MKAWKAKNRLGPPRGQRGIRSQKGQILVEYILLLFVVVSIAYTMTSLMVSRNENNPGFLIAKWRQIIDAIAADTADDLNPLEE